MSDITSAGDGGGLAGKFISPCPPPTPHEAEILALLIEECAEVQQRATKMLRFGVLEVQPGQPDTNSQRLCHELGDLMAVLRLAETAGLVNAETITWAEHRKHPKLMRFLRVDGRATAMLKAAKEAGL